MLFQGIPRPLAPVPATPRGRRLANDQGRLEELARESSIFSFEVARPPRHGAAPEQYRFRFAGPSLRLSHDGTATAVHLLMEHEVIIQLVADYPRSPPHMRWLTPIFHPNISPAGGICLGGWGKHWTPSLQLDQLGELLWDMLRFANYDSRSPYNPSAATWLREQRQYSFPLDPRELRDRRQGSSSPFAAGDRFGAGMQDAGAAQGSSLNARSEGRICRAEILFFDP